MSTREPDVRSALERGPRRSLLARLPAFYREQPELLAPLAEAAEELIEAHEAGIAQLAGRLAEAASSWAPEGARTRAGTVRALRDWLAARHGQAPRIACGLLAASPAAGSLEMRPARRPAALVAWDRDALPARIEALHVPGELAPPGVLVQVIVARLPPSGWPRAGERIAGEIVWEGLPAGSVGAAP